MTAAPTTHKAPTSCPHCGSTRVSAHHFRDAGDSTPEHAERSGYCPVLAARRTSSTIALVPSDARLAARMDLAPAIDDDDYAELLARALTSDLFS